MSYQSNIIGLSLIALLLLLPPLAWHIHSRNVPAVLLILWLFIMDLTSLVGASIWSEEDFMHRWNGKGWCDIVVKLQVGANIGMPCAVTNIVYNLHIILKADTVLPELNSWRKICCDLAISLTTPVVVMALSYIVQVARFGIVRYNGCQNMLSLTWLTIVLYTMWGLIWSIFGMLYALMVLYVFHKKRKDIKDILHCTNSKLNLARFSRLLILCLLVILMMFPLSLYAVVEDVNSIHGKYSWSRTHSSETWNIIPKFDEGKKLINVWIYISISCMVFIIFGLGEDAVRMYSNVLRTLRLGFIVDSWQHAVRTSRDSKITRLVGKISPDADKYQYNYCSDGASFSINSQSKFYVDYHIPFSDNKTSLKPSGIFTIRTAESSSVSNDDSDPPKNKFLPFFSERSFDDDYESLSAHSQVTRMESPPLAELRANPVLGKEHRSIVYYMPD